MLRQIADRRRMALIVAFQRWGDVEKNWPWAGSTHPGMQITCLAINPLSLGPSPGQLCQHEGITARHGQTFGDNRGRLKRSNSVYRNGQQSSLAPQEPLKPRVSRRVLLLQGDTLISHYRKSSQSACVIIVIKQKRLTLALKPLIFNELLPARIRHSMVSPGPLNQTTEYIQFPTHFEL